MVSDVQLQQNLEDTISNLRRHSASLEADLERATNEAAECKTRIVLVRRALFRCRGGVKMWMMLPETLILKLPVLGLPERVLVFVLRDSCSKCLFFEMFF